MTVDALKATLGRWAAAGSLMARGRPIGTFDVNSTVVTEDSGEALGLGAANLTVTVGFGPSLFDDRFGLRDKRPAALKPLPELPGDATLDPAISHGDLCVQACADEVGRVCLCLDSAVGDGLHSLRFPQVDVVSRDLSRQERSVEPRGTSCGAITSCKRSEVIER